MAEQFAHDGRNHTSASEPRQQTRIATASPSVLTLPHEQDTHTTHTHWSDPTIKNATTGLLTDTDKATTVIQGWPNSPKQIKSSWWIILSIAVFDLILFTCAVAFLAFAAIVSYYNQTPTIEIPQTTEMLISATKYGPTVFPILFALILGRATHTILRWRLECGETIKVLDTLAASTSLTSTLVSQFQLRTISLCGIVLALIWAFSPIGGQASIRQMTIGIKSTTQLESFEYLVHHGHSNGLQVIGTSRNAHQEIVNTIFVGGIIGPLDSKTSPVDTWGNVKIPRIEYYESRAKADADGWFETTSGSTDSYSSMIGIPVSGINSSRFVKYRTTVQTPYFQTQCSFTTRPQSNNWTIPQSMVNITGVGAIFAFDNARQMGRAYSDPEILPPLQFQYSTRNWNSNNHDLNCALTSSYVETQITCLDIASCTATRVRRSKVHHPPPNWTYLDLHPDSPGVLFREILSSIGGRPSWATVLDRYLSDPNSVLTLSKKIDVVSLTTKENYSIRLAQLLNSYFTIMGGMYTIAGGLNNATAFKDDNTTSFVPLVNDRNSTAGASRILWYQFKPPTDLRGRIWSAKGTKDTETEVIIAHKPWVITLCFSSIVLILASLISPFVHVFLIKGPEVMMNISSLATRHNSYIPLPEGGTRLGASTRAQLLKSVRIRFGDVERGSEVGRLVIGSMTNKDELEIARIRSGKLYE